MVTKNAPLLETQNLSGGYQSRNIVQEIDISVTQGEWLSILGPNGSGKSTLLKLMGRILHPTAGKVLLAGKEIHHQSPQTVARQLALLPQSPPIPDGLTVRQMVSLGRNPYQAWWQWELDIVGKKQVSAALHQTNLLPWQGVPIEQLSGGQRQRAFLALALAQNPQILLLDEPTTFLDVRYQLEILELLRALQQNQGLTIVVVLHDLNLALRYSDRIGLMDDGKLFKWGTPQEVLTAENLRAVFGIEVSWLETPLGPQILPLRSV